MIRSRESKAARSGQSGFTLIELVVALGVTSIVMLGIMFLFDFNNKLTRVQTNVADMQQSLRIAQYDMVRLARMAGRGGLSVAQGVVVTRDVEDEPLFDDGGSGDAPTLMPGTDVLTLRGVFSTPIFSVSFTKAGSFQVTGSPPTQTGFVEICALSPSGAVQDLASIRDQLTRTGALAEALVLVSPLDDRYYRVVSLDPASTNTNAGSCPNTGPTTGGLHIGFNVDDRYISLSAPLGLREHALEKVAYVGVLEEYRFYVRREDRDDVGGRPGYEVTEMTPVLSRARFLPATDTPYGASSEHRANLRQDIADGVVDLQIAEGFDVDNDGVVTENTADPDTDEWFGNAAGEAAVSGRFKGLRISTLVRTRRPDNTYEAPFLAGLEDHVYDTVSPGNVTGRFNGEIARKYRRRVLQTIVNLRNLTL